MLRPWLIAAAVAAVGVAWQYAALFLVEMHQHTFVGVPDPLLDRWPRIDFGVYGELYFFSLLALFAWFHIRHNWRATPQLIGTLGLMYFIRGWMQLWFPIGPPAGAVGVGQRITIWGHESHAFFPGGHIAVLTIMALLSPVRWVRWALAIGLVLFGLGTMLAKTHYTYDSVTGIMLGYACVLLVRGRLETKQSTVA